MNDSLVSLPKAEAVLSPRRVGIAGAAALVGCIACCAVPLVAAAGLGGGALTALSAIFRPGSELLVGGAAFVTALGAMAVGKRLRRNQASGGGTSCSADRTCGETSDATFSMQRESPSCCGVVREAGEEPLVCTLAGQDQAARVAEFREAFAHLEATEAIPGGFRWRFRSTPGLQQRLSSLARREHECCRFFEFRVSEEAGSILWEARTDARARPILDELMVLPETLKTLPSLDSMKVALNTAGLSFVSDRCDVSK